MASLYSKETSEKNVFVNSKIITVLQRLFICEDRVKPFNDTNANNRDDH
jgi:hypothetical protein